MRAHDIELSNLGIVKILFPFSNIKMICTQDQIFYSFPKCALSKNGLLL